VGADFGGEGATLYKKWPWGYNDKAFWAKEPFEKEEGMVPLYESIESALWVGGIKIFILVWNVKVSIAVTARLERIIKLLEEKK